MKYKNTNAFSMIIDSSEGRLVVGPQQEFESVDEITRPGILKITGHKEEVKVAPLTEPAFGKSNPIDLKTELQKRFDGRFRA